MAERALEGVRIIECGHLVSAAYAAKLMADMGAEVIKIEEPANGDQARQRGPYPGHVPHPEKSGLFLYLNTNKYGITLDLQQAAGQEILHRLLTDVDILIHNYHPTEMASLGLDYSRLEKVNPRLVMTSIAPFGLSGPHKDYQATDLTLWNAGGVAYLNGGGPGTDEMPPLKAFGQQAGFQAGVNAGIVTLGALFTRLATGEGQHVEVSAQECLLSILELTFEFFPYMDLVTSRLGQKPIQPLDFLECKDGWIFLCCVEEHQWRNFVELMGSPEWAGEEIFADRLSRGTNWDALQPLLQDWIKAHSVENLYHQAQSRRVPIAPVSTMGDLFANAHLKARGFFATLDHSATGPLQCPGALYKFSATPWEIRRPAPLLGQHNTEVYGRLGLSAAAIENLRQQRVI
ncbi:MAG TPA: CoA transferase [Candidatus Binatia bacterium]|nr:CoA transferase [Candidatus Binatia bacterium]